LKTPIYFLTFNDSPDGVYQSQVVDVVKLFRELGFPTKLISWVPARLFFTYRSTLKSMLPGVTVYPMFPGLKRWKLNRLYFSLVSIPKQSIVFARGIFAMNLAHLGLKSIPRIVYDGRGAIFAEQQEYGIYNGTGLEDEIKGLEQLAVHKSHAQLAVSQMLIEYWKEKYDFVPDRCAIVPCTYGKAFGREKNEVQMAQLRKALDFHEDDLILVYSGSLAAWQAMDSLKHWLEKILASNPKVKLLFLSKPHALVQNLKEKFPKRVHQRFVSPEEVPGYLDVGDYGLLLREQSVTNQVASPVKFAEYLSRGMKVLISQNIGDYSKWVEEHELGMIIEDWQTIPVLEKPNKESSKQFAFKKLSKNSPHIIEQYFKLFKE
jgi:hypothetical protein